MSKQKAGGKSKEVTQQYQVSPGKFIEIWETSETAEEASERLKMPKDIAAARASQYRAMGINLKKMKRNYKKAIDVEQMNARIAEIRSESGVDETEPADSNNVERPTLSGDNILGEVEAALAGITPKKK